MVAYLELNNARNNGACILLNVNGTGWNSYTTKAPSGKTTNIEMKDAQGGTPSVTSLYIRFLSGDNPDGGGKGVIDAQYSAGANSATVVLGNSGGTPPTDNCCLALEADGSFVVTAFAYIQSTG